MKEKMSTEDRKALNDAKKSYKKEMKAFLGANWRKISKRMRVYNAPNDTEMRAAYQQAASLITV